MSILGDMFDFIKDVIHPVKDLVDNVHTSEEEKLELKRAIFELEVKSQEKFAELQLKAAELQTELIKHETEHGNWLQKSWRPLSMLVFLGLLLAESFGVLSQPLPDWVGTLFQIGFGSYIIGRSGEKIIPVLFKNGEKK